MLKIRVLFAKSSPLVRTCQFANGQQRVLSSTKGTPNEDVAPVETKQMSSRSKVIAFRMERNAKAGSAKKLLKLANKEKTLFEVHEKMSIVDLSRIVNKDKDTLLDVALSHPKCNINSEKEALKNRSLMEFLAKKMNVKFKFVKPPQVDEKPKPNLDVVHPPPKLEDLVARPPVVAIVGHIDHGKTTLLDRLRKSNVVESEFGGITQHIGAFSVSLSNFQNGLDKVTFLDTPGHAAFKNMRIRGALITDIVILVVDACEGPLEQTLESIDAIKKARVSYVVALNKIDKPNADVEKSKKALYEAGINLEDFGGDVQCIPISALNGNGVDELVEALLTQAEVLQLSADPKGPIEGTVIESFQEHGLGKTATVLIKRGTLKKGKILVCGEHLARVKLMLDTRAPLGDEMTSRNELKSVGPAEACRITGWKSLPHAGQVVMEVENEKRAQEVIRWRAEQRQEVEKEDLVNAITEKRASDRKVYDEFRLKKLEKGDFRNPVFGSIASEAGNTIKENYKSVELDRRVSIVIKADVDGSLEAIMNCLKTYDNDNEEVMLDLINYGVGEITESDLKFAQDFNGIVYAFNIPVSDMIRKAASSIYDNVPIREHQVIYTFMDDLKEEISQKLPMKEVENVLGKGVIAKEFTMTEKKVTVFIAGCRVHQGVFSSKSLFKVKRGKQVVYDGPLHSLKHLKDEVNEIKQGQECGIRLADGQIQLQPGDMITCYEIKQENQTTDWSPPGF